MKSVVLLSGGMDSAVSLGLQVSKYGNANTLALSFDYGSKHNHREGMSAAKVAFHCGVKRTVIKLPFFGNSDSSLMTGEIPKGHYTSESQKSTVLPYRNGVLISIGVYHAESVGFDCVVVGCHGGDHPIYPDCRDEFIQVANQAAQLGTYSKIQVLSPLQQYDKLGVLKLGLGLKVPVQYTYSCYKGDFIPCGECGACVERKEAFDLVGARDICTL